MNGSGPITISNSTKLQGFFVTKPIVFFKKLFKLKLWIQNYNYLFFFIVFVADEKKMGGCYDDCTAKYNKSKRSNVTNV